jgi:hypothetical protein
MVIRLCAGRDGSIMYVLGHTEPDHGSDHPHAFHGQLPQPQDHQQVKATRKGDKFLLTGQKAAWVSNGPLPRRRPSSLISTCPWACLGGGIGLIDLTQRVSRENR